MPSRYVVSIAQRIGKWIGAQQARAARARAAAFQSRPHSLDEAYIAQATSISDVEYRIRELERRRVGFLY